ncbi:hypothetical protein [Peribacillus simplex]|uniref:hypothetical protein n=1 Tax=Peribacillus simplex TaxID=1478 RepID=UPI00366F5846
MEEVASASLRQEHKVGEKFFIDYAGPTTPVIDVETGEMKETQFFVATLGASSYAHVEALWGQNLRNCYGMGFIWG